MIEANELVALDLPRARRRDVIFSFTIDDATVYELRGSSSRPGGYFCTCGADACGHVATARALQQETARIERDAAHARSAAIASGRDAATLFGF
jgi:hypothetical protein